MIHRRWFYVLLWFALLFTGYIGVTTPVTAQERGPIYQVDVTGTVTNVTINYLERALRQAEASDATALIIQLGSEGAVLRAIRPFANQLADASVPVVVYVTPSGTQSGAPGAFFLSAAHIAAMAPDTSFGTPTPLADVDALLTEQTQNLVLNSVEQQLRAWNAARGRNTDWVDRAVRDGVQLTNQQAAAMTPPAIDIVASGSDELLTLLEGRVVQLENGETLQLQTLGRSPTALPPNLWERFRLLLADPTVAFLLLILGAIAVYGELANPGTTIFAGIGVVMLLGAMVGMLSLPVRWISVVGLIFAFTLIAMDLFVPSHGALTVFGIVVLIVSALTLIDTRQAPNTFVALWAILMVVLLTALFAALSIWLIVRTRKQPVSTGQEGLIGQLAEVRQRLAPDGMVFIEGALWRAISEDGIVETGEWVRVTAVYNLRLAVRRLDVADEGDGAPFHRAHQPTDSHEA